MVRYDRAAQLAGCNSFRLAQYMVLVPGTVSLGLGVLLRILHALICLEGAVISAHRVQVACFLFIDSRARKRKGYTPKIVEPLNFAPLRYSLNSRLHRR